MAVADGLQLVCIQSDEWHLGQSIGRGKDELLPAVGGEGSLEPLQAHGLLDAEGPGFGAAQRR